MVKSFSDHFSGVALAYASWRPRYPEKLFTYLQSLVSRRALAWDCAAGSGQATIPLASRFDRVIGTDISASMLSQAPPHPKVEYRVAPAHSSGLPDAAVDLVTVAQALHWLNTDDFYLEARRVLADHGVLAVWTYGVQHVAEPNVDRELGRFYRDVLGPYWPADRRHVEAGYRTLPFPFAELETPGFTMEEHWTLPRLLGYLRTWSATQRFRDQKGHDPVDTFEHDLAALWGDPTREQVIRWPLSLRVGRKPL